MTESENFLRARDNEADDRYLGTTWTRFRDFDIEERTEHDVYIRARQYDPGLPQPRKMADGSQVQSYSGEWLFKDDNSKGLYAPLREEPDLFLKFAALASKDPRTRDGRLEIMLDWIKTYGVLGLILEGNSRSERRENLLPFWFEVHRAAKCMALYEALTGPGRVLKRSGIPGKTLAEKRKEVVKHLDAQIGTTLRRHCYPKLYSLKLKDTGEPAGFALSWGFRSLLGAMYLQLAWRIKSRQCEAPGCNNVIGLHERSDKHTCSKACKERRRQHRQREGAA
jgi:hypothetical protein